MAKWEVDMKAKSIAIIATFTALCIALVPFRIPAFNWPGMFYYWWEIPIVAAYLLFGFKTAFSIALLNLVARLLYFQPPGAFLMFAVSLPPLLTMLLGVYIAQRLFTKKVSMGKPLSEPKKGTYMTALGVAVRAGAMPLVGYLNYHTFYPFFLGRAFSEAYVVGLLPGILLFNIIVPLYTVSIGYIVAKTVDKNLKVGNPV